MRACRKCSIALDSDNWKKSSAKRKDYICKVCLRKEHARLEAIWKKEIFQAYGGQCVCCGESNSIFLTIDHVDGKGSEHRKLIGLSSPTGKSFYHWLKKQGYPKDNYQILCFNCNFAKHVLGRCPHQHVMG